MDAREPRVVCLSTILFTHRMLFHTDFLPRLARDADVSVWADAVGSDDFDRVAKELPATFERFPDVADLRNRYSLLRRVNEAAWDVRSPFESRKSFWRLRRRNSEPGSARAARAVGKGLGSLGLRRNVERFVGSTVLRQERSPEARDRLRTLSPSALLATSPFRLQEPGVVAEAIKLGIPVAGLITSWDNLSTKNRMLFDYDAFIVWSERMREELLTLYPAARDVPVHVVGAPQFDVFFQERFIESREDFCARYGFDVARPIILYALGSPDLLREHHGAWELAQALRAGRLGDVQMLVRPHPLHPIDPAALRLASVGPQIALQRLDADPERRRLRFHDDDDVRLWANSFRHSDVVVNLSSTATVDAAILDRPVVNLDFDPQPGQEDAQLVHDINHRWAHFKPIAESGGVWLARDHDDVVRAVRGYLADPSLHREQRAWIARYVAGTTDGKAGERAAEAMLHVLGTARERARSSA